VSISELKLRLADVPGIETLTMQLIGGRQVFGFNGLIAAVDPMATDQEIETAIRDAADLAKFGRGPAEKQAAATDSAALIPSVQLAPATNPTGAKPMSVTGAGHAGLKLRELMDAHKRRIAQLLDDNLAKVQAGFDKQLQGAAAVGTLGDKVNAEGDDLLASVGQFTNDLGLE
jgi:hypothetical protein